MLEILDIECIVIGHEGINEILGIGSGNFDKA
jgi:hypothetical protein